MPSEMSLVQAEELSNAPPAEEEQPKSCVACFSPIDLESLSFEQRLINDEHFCRRCFDEIMRDESLPYLDNPKKHFSNL